MECGEGLGEGGICSLSRGRAPFSPPGIQLRIGTREIGHPCFPHHYYYKLISVPYFALSQGVGVGFLLDLSLGLVKVNKR